MKKNKGITLIGLVITIIVLLILTGVGISALSGDNGMIKMAVQASNKYADEQEREKQILDEYETLISDTLNGKSEANKPDMSGFNKSNTYYVTWDLTTSPYTINDATPISKTAPSNWYDYTKGVNQWANIKTTGGGNDCYWVWIPRYAYQVPEKSASSQKIEVKFLDGKTNNPKDGSSITISNNTNVGSWNVSPAFWWDIDNDGQRENGEELSGIWIAKFEASSSQVSAETLTTDLATTGGGDTTDLKVRSIPNVTSWRGMKILNMLTVCKNLTAEGNSLEGTTDIDSHGMRNSDWGAVAYLSRSAYGKESAVWNNPYYSDTTNYSTITGLAGASQDASQMDLTNTYEYNTQGGVNASTTGNVYGIYDMAGGAWEYVGGILYEVWNLGNFETKYIDKYEGSSCVDEENYALNTNKYGDAIYETSVKGTGSYSADSDDSYYLTSHNSVFVRGGGASNGIYAGIFAYHCAEGDLHETHGFRPCLVME